MVSSVVNKHFKMWLWILIGLNIITKVHGYGDGLFDDPQSCQLMLPNHRINDVQLGPQNTQLPFEIDVKRGNKGDPITVILRSKQSTEFRGFILQARKTGSDVPVGKFIALESHGAQLLRCTGSTDSAVSQQNNQRKNLFRVNWTSTETTLDNVFFSVTFVEDYSTFWAPVDKEIPIITTTTPSTTTSTEPSTTTTTEPSTTTNTETSATTNTETSATTNTDPSTTTNTETSATTNTDPSTTAPNTTAPPPPPNPLWIAVAGTLMIADSVIEFVGMGPPATDLCNNPFSRRLIRVSKITCSLLCAAIEFSTLVLFCVAEHIKITLITLVCMAIVINFVKLVILCLPIGPSHELKEICDITVKVCSVIHQIFTIAVIFVVVMETENCRIGTGISNRKDWLPKVMVAYTVWILLFVIWDIISTQRTAILGRSKIGKQQRKEKLRAAKGIVIAVSVILLVGNLCFAVAVAVGLFECQEK